MSGLVDANKLTVAKLKSALSEAGYSEQLNVREKKAYFVGLYNKLILPQMEKESKGRKMQQKLNDENLPNMPDNSQEETPLEDKRKKARRQTLSAVPTRTPMTPLQAGTPKRIAKRSSARQSLLPSRSKVKLIDESEEDDSSRDVEDFKETLETRVTEPKAVIKVEETAKTEVPAVEIKPFVEPVTVVAAPQVMSPFGSLTPIASGRDSLLYLRQRKRFKTSSEETKDEEDQKTEEQVKEKPQAEERSQPQCEEVVKEKEVTFAELPPAPLHQQEQPAESRPLRRRSLVAKPKVAASTRGLGFYLIILELALAAGLVLFFFPSLMELGGLGGLGKSNSSAPFCDTAAFGTPEAPCLRCPTNANCRDGKMECYNMHKWQNGECVPDETYHLSALEMKDAARRLLDERGGRHRCGYEDATTPHLTEHDLRQRLQESSSPDVAKFSAIFTLMHSEVMDHPEWGISIREENTTGLSSALRTFWTVDEPSLPLACALQVRLLDNLWQVLLAVAIALAIPVIWWRRRRAAQEDAEVEALVEEVKSLLAAQRERSDDDPDRRVLPWVPITHVRDTLFHDDPLRKKRGSGGVGGKNSKWLKIWDRVVKAVSNDRRILASPQLFEGEQVTTWEWISLVPSNRSSGLMSPTRQRRSEAREAASAVPEATMPVQREEETVNITTSGPRKSLYPSFN